MFVQSLKFIVQMNNTGDAGWSMVLNAAPYAETSKPLAIRYGLRSIKFGFGFGFEFELYQAAKNGNLDEKSD
jgi:hypothetical protein